MRWGGALAFVAAMPLAMAPAQSQSVCTAPQPVCDARHAVFRVTGYLPAASAVRIGPGLLVTTRQAVADRPEITVMLGAGRATRGRVVPSSYAGDLVLIEADLADGPALVMARAREGAALFAVAYDGSTGAVAVSGPTTPLVLPAPERPLARLHLDLSTIPANYGGALVDEVGGLVGIIISGGGDERGEALPARAIAALEAASGPQHAARSAELGAAYRACDEALGEARGERGALPAGLAARVERACLDAGNRVQIERAAQAFGQRGDLDRSALLFEAALTQDPQSIATRIGLAMTLHLSGRYSEGAAILGDLIHLVPDDSTVLRLAVQAGKWGGAPELAEEGLRLVERTNPQEAASLRRFLEADMPPPRRAPQLR